MRHRSRAEVLAAILAASLASCASNPAPRGWLPPARELQHSTYGGWITVRCEGTATACAAGELIAASAKSLHILTDHGLVELPVVSVEEATLAVYQSDEKAMGVWGFLGTLSTLSHGVYLLISAPVWIVSASVAAGAESRAGLLKYPKKPITSLRPYARFPQGLPAGLDEAALGPLREPLRRRD